MTIDQCLALAASHQFQSRIKFLAYRSALAVLKDAGSGQNLKSAARKLLDDELNLARVGLMVVTETLFYDAQTPDEITDEALQTALFALIPVLLS